MFSTYFRHGLIPNRLNKGINARYNARDVCWWYIKAIFDYIYFTNELKFL